MSSTFHASGLKARIMTRPLFSTALVNSLKTAFYPFGRGRLFETSPFLQPWPTLSYLSFPFFFCVSVHATHNVSRADKQAFTADEQPVSFVVSRFYHASRFFVVQYTQTHMPCIMCCHTAACAPSLSSLALVVQQCDMVCMPFSAYASAGQSRGQSRTHTRDTRYRHL